MGKIRNILGQKFGRLLVKKEVGRAKNNKMLWECECDCGNTIRITSDRLVSGHTQSCGCYRREKTIERHFIHGKSHTPEHDTWQRIMNRCYNKNSKDYKNYGGRGIKVDPRWLNSFENFLEDMGERPTPLHSIDRIDNDGNYSPGNCRWATKKEQNRNYRSNVMIKHDGKIQCMKDWAKELGIKYGTLQTRIRRGWSAERALMTQVQRYR